MKNKNQNRIACVFLALLGQPAWSYEQLTHQDLSQKAAQASRVEDPALLADLALLRGQEFPGSDGKLRSITGLIRHGADLEDEGTRPTNHFFDPHHDRPATLPPWLTIGIAVGETSPDWIVDGTDQEPGEEFSVRRARELFVEGLAAVTPESRNTAWGRMFQSLGHVIHHLQDMAQPQHVRNDVHYINEFLATHFDGDFKLVWEDRSWFEKYSLENPAIWGAYAPAAATPVTFSRARDFWATADGRGIAQFTNRNFVSSDTNFTYGSNQGDMRPAEDYPSPEPLGRYTRSLRDPALGIANAEDLCARLAVHPVGRGQPCEIDFIGSLVSEGPSGGQPVLNDRAASFSVFDAELRDIDHVHFGLRLFTLNSVNFKAAYRFLIPQAINYSAGMINHFFRGRLQLRNVDVQDSNVTVDLANVSAPGNDFSRGTFSVYYDSISGARKPLATEAADLFAGASRQLRFVVPSDLDLRAENPFVVVFDGQIGAEAGVSGLVFDVPDVVRGFVFGASLPNGPGAQQLLYRSPGQQWRLHPQGQHPSAGSVDWKGWYVDNKPTRMLAWDGWRYAKLSTVVSQRSPRIYASGKPMAVAPWPVLGAALQKDPAGGAWIVAICEDKVLDQDVVVRRPARKSTSAALYDAATAPDGWRVIGRFPRPPHLSSERETWQFNGAGTEAQALRALAGIIDEHHRPHTRLKVVLSGDTAVFEELGNTKALRTIIADVTASRTVEGQTYDDCNLTGTIDATVTITTTGGSVVAVDYVDDQEVLARINVESSRVRTEHGSAVGPVWVDADQTETNRWTLEIGADRHELLSEVATYRHRYSSAERYLLDASRSVLTQGAIVELDLRSGLVFLRRSHEESSAETIDPTTPYGSSAQSVSVYHQYAIAGAAGAASAPVDVSSADTLIDVDGTKSTFTHRCDRGITVPSGRETSEESFDLNVLTGHIGYNAPADIITSATDRSGNVFLSLRHTDAVTKQYHYFNYLTGADPVALLGVDPQRPQFWSIRPR